MTASRPKKLAVTASSAAAARFQHRHHVRRWRSASKTLGPPSPFVAIATQFVLVHLHLGEHVFHSAQFGPGYGETCRRGTRNRLAKSCANLERPRLERS
jgi:hypothetical protein